MSLADNLRKDRIRFLIGLAVVNIIINLMFTANLFNTLFGVYYAEASLPWKIAGWVLFAFHIFLFFFMWPRHAKEEKYLSTPSTIKFLLIVTFLAWIFCFTGLSPRL